MFARKWLRSYNHWCRVAERGTGLTVDRATTLIRADYRRDWTIIKRAVVSL